MNVPDGIARRLREALTSPDISAPRRVQEIRRIAGAPPEEAARALATATRGLHPDLIGYGALPPLAAWFREPEGFEAGLGLLADREAGPALRLALIDALDAAARSRGGERPHAAAIRTLAADDAEPAELRLRAIRQLARDRSEATQTVLEELAEGAVAELAYEATYALSARATAGHGRPPRAALVQASPGLALEIPAVAALRALALAERPAADAITGLLARAGTPEALARVVGALGDRFGTDELASAVAHAGTRRDAQSDWTLRALLANDGADALADTEHDRALLTAAELMAGHEGVRARARLLALAASDDVELAPRAAALLAPRELPDDLRTVRIGDGDAIDPVALERRLEPSRSPRHDGPRAPVETADGPGPPPPGAAEFSTGFHVGDGFYRDLILPLAHWHTGVYLGFTPNGPAPGMCQLSGINASQGIGWSDTMAFFTATRSFASPTTDVAGTMAALRTELISAFKEGHEDKAFHGARRPAGMTSEQRFAVAATAASLFAKNIWWTWVDMLDYKWFDWDGGVADIDESRCDGVVEYSYERNGIRLCGGQDPARWNISTAGTANVENHNDYHNGNYQQGELCPRIQAGDTGDAAHAPAADTTMTAGPVTPPAVEDFAVYGFAFIFVPSIWFRITTGAYRTAHVRITVSKDGGPWRFVQTEDPYGGTAPPALLGDWRFRQVRANTADRQFGWWMGKTADGVDYRGQDGSFAFRLVAVDPAGNVSALASTTAQIAWPRPPARRVRCIDKPRRASPDERIRAIGGTDDAGAAWRLTLSQAIARIGAGDRFYVEEPTGDRVEVVVAISRNGHRYLKTEADGDVPNNLLALPNCP